MEFNLWKPLAGLALFLLAMSLMEEAIRRLAGNRFKTMLAEHTDTPLEGVLSGTVATAILQSSSFVSLLMLAFVGAKVLPLKNAVAVVMGANLGTTATGWIVAAIGFKLDLEGFALPLIALGGLVSGMESAHRLRQPARLTLALGLLLLGLQFMKDAVGDVSGLVDLSTLEQLSAVHYLLLGIGFSALVQSSSATMVIALSALDAGVIDLPQAAAMAIGADMGTTSTVILGAIGASANKKRVALGHFLFNLITDSLGFLLRLPLLASLAFIGESTLRLVGFHSAMNVIGIALFLPFLDRFTRYLERCFAQPAHRESHFLDDATSAAPEAAVQALQNEARHLLQRVIEHNQILMAHAAGLGQDADAGVERGIVQSYLGVKELEGEIVNFALALDRSTLALAEQERLEDLLGAIRSSVVAMKTCKETTEDLLELADTDQQLLRRLCDAQQHFYDGAQQGGSEQSALLSSVDELHAQLHEGVQRSIKDGVIAGHLVSTAFNMNRMLYHSNHALAQAVIALGAPLAPATPVEELANAG